MNHNRLSGHFDRPRCRCNQIKRELQALAEEARRIETLIAGEAELVVPDLADALKGQMGVRLFILSSCPETQPDEDLTAYAARELKRMGLELLAAAERVEGGAA